MYIYTYIYIYIYIYLLCVCNLALIVRHANRIFSAPHYILICAQSGSTVYFHINSQKAQFSRKKIEQEMCALRFPTIFIRNICLSIKIQRQLINVSRPL